MKKIILLLTVLFFLGGCTNTHATDPVKEYLNKFRNNDKEVTIAVNELLRQEDLLKEQESLYLLIMKKQYVDLEYKIIGEKYNGNQAVITVELTVYDYENSRIEALKYRSENKSEYQMSDGTWNKEKYMNLQLRYMKEENKRVKYTVDFNVNLQSGNWVLENPNREVIEKIHGLYQYKKD